MMMIAFVTLRGYVVKTKYSTCLAAYKYTRVLCLMLIAFITVKSGLVPLFQDLCIQTYFRFAIISGFEFKSLSFPSLSRGEKAY